VKHIDIERRNVYGSIVYYPMSRDAHVFAGLAGTATLSPRTLSRIASLGYTIEVWTRASKAGAPPVSIGPYTATAGV
jgi:hypothetical protein